MTKGLNWGIFAVFGPFWSFLGHFWFIFDQGGVKNDPKNDNFLIILGLLKMTPKMAFLYKIFTKK